MSASGLPGLVDALSAAEQKRAVRLFSKDRNLLNDPILEMSDSEDNFHSVVDPDFMILKRLRAESRSFR